MNDLCFSSSEQHWKSTKYLLKYCTLKQHFELLYLNISIFCSQLYFPLKHIQYGYKIIYSRFNQDFWLETSYKKVVGASCYELFAVVSKRYFPSKLGFFFLTPIMSWPLKFILWFLRGGLSLRLGILIYPTPTLLQTSILPHATGTFPYL